MNFQAYTNRRRSERNMSGRASRSEEHTSELQSQSNLVCRLLLEKKKKIHISHISNTTMNPRVPFDIQCTRRYIFFIQLLFSRVIAHVYMLGSRHPARPPACGTGV